MEEVKDITILDHCNCIVCDRPFESGVLRKQIRSKQYPELYEVEFKFTHESCEILYNRLKKAKEKMEDAEEEIMSMEFAIFLKKTHFR
jgi:hypothetical protein